MSNAHYDGTGNSSATFLIRQLIEFEINRGFQQTDNDCCRHEP